MNPGDWHDEIGDGPLLFDPHEIPTEAGSWMASAAVVLVMLAVLIGGMLAANWLVDHGWIWWVEVPHDKA